MHQIRSLETGRGPQGFSKNFSEHDFLHKELLKVSQDFITQINSTIFNLKQFQIDLYKILKYFLEK